MPPQTRFMEPGIKQFGCNTSSSHTTFLRNKPERRIIYFGQCGNVTNCRIAQTCHPVVMPATVAVVAGNIDIDPPSDFPCGGTD